MCVVISLLKTNKQTNKQKNHKKNSCWIRGPPTFSEFPKCCVEYGEREGKMTIFTFPRIL